MTPAALSPAAPASSGVAERAARSRLEVLFATHFDFIWRSLRRFGLSEDRADDAAQQVFMIASRKLDAIREGSERSFLFGTAMRVASDIRKSAPVRREIVREDVGVDLEGGARPDDLLDRPLELVGHLASWDLGGLVDYRNSPEGGACVVATFDVESA